MFDFFKPKVKAIKFPKEEILPRYYKMRTWNLSGVFIGYMGYYLVRNNITLSTPFIQNQLDLSKSDIGTITGSMLIAYGISKGAMSVISDKADPKKIYGFRSYFMCSCKCFTWFFKFFLRLCRFCYLAWVFQSMGVGPSFITLVNWYPKKERGIYTAVWNISHNIGDEIVAPIVSLSGFALAALLGVSMADFNETYWHMNHFYVPAACAVIISLYVLYAVKGSPKNEGLVDISEINEMRGIKTEEIKAVETPNLSSFEIFYRYVLKNKNAWYVAWMDTFVLWCVLGLFLGFLFTY